MRPLRGKITCLDQVSSSEELYRIMGSVPKSPKIYHITHVDNLESIIGDGVILSDRAIQERGGPNVSVGMPDIKRRRMLLPVKCHDGDCVGDYVPFYFCPRSVMLYIISKANHPGLMYREGQDNIVHLEADLFETIEWAEHESRRWAFTTSNAGAVYAAFYNDRDMLTAVNWEAVQSRDFRDQAVKEGKLSSYCTACFPGRLLGELG